MQASQYLTLTKTTFTKVTRPMFWRDNQGSSKRFGGRVVNMEREKLVEMSALEPQQELAGEGTLQEAVGKGTKRVPLPPRIKRFVCFAVLLSSLLVLLLAVVLVSVLVGKARASATLPTDPYQRAVALLDAFPVIDGHNDLAEQLRSVFQNQLDQVDLTKNGSGAPPDEVGPSWHTDIPRLRAGRVGGQFWSAYMSCSSQYKDAMRGFVDQIDVVKQFVAKYPTAFKFATSVADIEEAAASGRIASLIGVEGGHAIDSSLGSLRQLYDLGARYMTLTHTCNTPWSHSSVDNGTGGLNGFGQKVVREMNRLGMLVDISHVNTYTMSDVLDISLAPVIFSHSSAYALCNNPRNVPDNILRRLTSNGGIVMVNFFPMFISCSSKATLGQVADHIDHLRAVAGVDHVGIGSDFDGIHTVPVGLEDVSKYPALFAELISRGYSDEEVTKVARLNIMRVLGAVEKASDDLQSVEPDNSHISPQPDQACRPDF